MVNRAFGARAWYVMFYGILAAVFLKFPESGAYRMVPKFDIGDPVQSPYFLDSASQSLAR